MKKSIALTLLISSFFGLMVNGQDCFSCKEAPLGTIFCDDFEANTPLKDRYFEYGGSGGKFVPVDGVGRDGSRGMRAIWQAGDVGVGGFKKSFGRTPSNYIGKHAVNPNEEYDEIYWRLDLRTQPGWQGGGADKLSRAMTLANSNWAQGLIAHIWSSGKDNEFLLMDPASGIDAKGNLASTKYNDWNNLRWLGAKVGNIQLFSTANSDKWYCVEAHVKINKVGEKDGVFEFWINDSIQNGSYNLNWHGEWNRDKSKFKINAIFVENYWNAGSPVKQERYMDNFVISTERIGCECDMTTSNDNYNSSYSVDVFPNPSSNYLNIRIERKLAIKGYSLTIINSLGQNVLRTSEIKSILHAQDLSSFAAGNYHYIISTDGDLIDSGSLQIQN